MTPPPTAASPHRKDHIRSQSISETVLLEQTVLDDAPPITSATTTDEVSIDLAEHHEALIGDEFRNPTNIMKQPTLATLGETPFNDDGDEVEVSEHLQSSAINDM